MFGKCAESGSTAVEKVSSLWIESIDRFISSIASVSSSCTGAGESVVVVATSPWEESRQFLSAMAIFSRLRSDTSGTAVIIVTSLFISYNKCSQLKHRHWCVGSSK